MSNSTTQRMSSPAEQEAQKELQIFLQSENLKARFQQQVHEFTEMCWDKCIGKIGNKLEKSDENCLGNCVERFLDAGQLLVKRLEQYAG